MKKLLSLILCVIFFLLSACSSEPEKAEINRNFEAEAQINYQSTAFTAKIRSSRDGCSAVFCAPEELEGLEISYNGLEFSYRLGELAFTCTKLSQAQQFLPLLFEALNDQNAVFEKNENGYTATGTASGHNYYININNTQFNPTFFEIEELALTVKFNF